MKLSSGSYRSNKESRRPCRLWRMLPAITHSAKMKHLKPTHLLPFKPTHLLPFKSTICLWLKPTHLLPFKPTHLLPFKSTICLWLKQHLSASSQLGKSFVSQPYGTLCSGSRDTPFLPSSQPSWFRRPRCEQSIPPAQLYLWTKSKTLHRPVITLLLEQYLRDEKNGIFPLFVFNWHIIREAGMQERCELKRMGLRCSSQS